MIKYLDPLRLFCSLSGCLGACVFGVRIPVFQTAPHQRRGFKATGKTMMRVRPEDTVTIMRKDPSGWWYSKKTLTWRQPSWKSPEASLLLYAGQPQWNRGRRVVPRVGVAPKQEVAAFAAADMQTGSNSSNSP